MQERIEPEAYLRTIRNVPRGVRARSRIVGAVRSDRVKKGREIADAAGLSYSATMRHLRRMRIERIIEKDKAGWSLTGLGQQAVTEYLRERR